MLMAHTQVIDTLPRRRPLTERQNQALNLLMNYETCREIGKAMNIRERTVKMHIRGIAKAFGIDGRKFWLRTRIVYLESIRRGLIKEFERIPNEVSFKRLHAVCHGHCAIHCS